jgi:CheY-like chemotaxis protein
MKRKIFLADDSITIQKVVELTFPESDFEVTCVASGGQAIDTIRKVVPDVALLDVIMPEKNGYEVCAQVKQDPDLKWMPVLLISGAFEPFDEKRAADAGASGRLTKPFESRALVAKVEALMAAYPAPGRPVEEAKPAPPVKAPVATSSQPAAPPASPAAAQTIRISSQELSAQPPPGTAHGSAQPADSPVLKPTAAAAPQTASSADRAAPVVQIPPEVLERAVREALAGISEKVVREVAWEVIPDLAESIILRRIRDLEEEAGAAE